MTWIAACNGECGIHQETVMTNEERQKLVAALQQLADPYQWPQYPIPLMSKDAADEIERLATRCNALERDLEWTRERVKNLEQKLPLVGVMRG